MEAINFSEQVAFDFRKETHRAANSLKPIFNIWEEKPQIIASEEVKNVKYPNSAIYLLPSED